MSYPSGVLKAWRVSRELGWRVKDAVAVPGTWPPLSCLHPSKSPPLRCQRAGDLFEKENGLYNDFIIQDSIATEATLACVENNYLKANRVKKSDVTGLSSVCSSLWAVNLFGTPGAPLHHEERMLTSSRTLRQGPSCRAHVLVSEFLGTCVLEVSLSIFGSPGQLLRLPSYPLVL